MASELPAEGPGAATAVLGAFSAFLDRVRQDYEEASERATYFRVHATDVPAALEPLPSIGEFHLTYGWPLRPITFYLYGDHSDVT